MSDYGCEAGSDSMIEAFVLLPTKPERELVAVQIMDINGTDYTIAQVKADLLKHLKPQELHKYKLAFKDEVTNEIKQAMDNQLITDFMDFLQGSQYTIVVKN
ncbi:hypothetical protein Btru_048932 [Bulinus truncatus]|nr:hypothetical protein Btru_048932 [Bulinus truncatus]